MAKKLSSNPTIFIPETIDELLDICAAIYRNEGGRFDGPTLAHIFPPAGIRDNHEDIIVFNNGGMPLCIWSEYDGVTPKKIVKDNMAFGTFLYAHRINDQEKINKFPIKDLRNHWIQWINVSDRYVAHAWDDATQYILKSL